jgi:hypothetical protein
MAPRLQFNLNRSKDEPWFKEQQARIDRRNEANYMAAAGRLKAAEEIHEFRSKLAPPVMSRAKQFYTTEFRVPGGQRVASAAIMVGKTEAVPNLADHWDVSGSASLLLSGAPSSGIVSTPRENRFRARVRRTPPDTYEVISFEPLP